MSWYKNKHFHFYREPSKYKIFYKDIKEIHEKINQREKMYGKDIFYSISKLMMDGDVKFLWKDCENIVFNNK